MTRETVYKPCPKCGGCREVADSEDQEPWSVWLALPPESNVAVRMGIVRPIPCPHCSGKGEIESIREVEK